MQAVLPLFRAMADGAEAALLRMHEGGPTAWAPPEDAPGGVLRASPYMADTTALLAHCRCGSAPPIRIRLVHQRSVRKCRSSPKVPHHSRALSSAVRPNRPRKGWIDKSHGHRLT